MRIDGTKPLFAWDCLDDSPTLATVKELLAALPEGPLLAALRRGRGKGRDDSGNRRLNGSWFAESP